MNQAIKFSMWLVCLVESAATKDIFKIKMSSAAAPCYYTKKSTIKLKHNICDIDNYLHVHYLVSLGKQN